MKGGDAAAGLVVLLAHQQPAASGGNRPALMLPLLNQPLQCQQLGLGLRRFETSPAHMGLGVIALICPSDNGATPEVC